MKTTGIILLVCGILATIGAIGRASQGYSFSFTGLAFAVLGAYLISRANKKKEEEKKKNRWAEGENVQDE